MKKRLWLIWYSLFIVCALLGFIPQPEGFWKFLCIFMSLGFFVPGGCLLAWAHRRGEVKTIRHIRNISIGSLALTTLFIMLNFASALMSELAGNILYGVLVVVSAPMICSQYWVMSLFCWACILFGSLSMLKKHSEI